MSIKNLKKITFLFILTISFVFCGLAQTPQQKADKIRADKNYFYGEGFGNTQKEADANAQMALTSSITTFVQSNWTSTIGQSSNGKGTEFYENINNLSKVNSFADINNSEMLMLESSAKGFRIFREIKK